MKKTITLLLSIISLLIISVGINLSAYATTGISCGYNKFYSFNEKGEISIYGDGEFTKTSKEEIITVENNRYNNKINQINSKYDNLIESTFEAINELVLEGCYYGTYSNYINRVNSLTSEISSLQKQYSAYENDNSEENKVKKSKLKKQLTEKKEELSELNRKYSNTVEKEILESNLNIYEIERKNALISEKEIHLSNLKLIENTVKYLEPTSIAKVTKRSTDDVAKDKSNAQKIKSNAQKIMTQAKITKLTAKSKASKKITVSWKKASSAKGYQVQVSAKKNFKKLVYNKFTSKNKLTLKNKKIKSGKKYFIRTRAYTTYTNENGTAVKVYSAWSKKIKKVKVK